MVEETCLSWMSVSLVVAGGGSSFKRKLFQILLSIEPLNPPPY
jgi:hypothetical protein